MTDFPTARFEERRQVVAIMPRPPTMLPTTPGEPHHDEVVVISNVRGLRPDMVETAVIATMRGQD